MLDNFLEWINHHKIHYSGISQHTQSIKEGDLFFLLTEDSKKASEFLGVAIEKGAVACVVGQNCSIDTNRVKCPLYKSSSIRSLLALFSVFFYQEQPRCCVAVTGTSGKTSVSFFLRQIWERMGYASASIGTLGIITSEQEVYLSTSLTTPGPIELNKTLKEMSENSITHVVMEASSHGLDQHRLDGIRFIAAGFTNFSQDHLDYHASMDDYFLAKMKLFREVLPENGKSVVITDDVFGKKILQELESQRRFCLSIGKENDSSLRIISLKREEWSTRVCFCIEGQDVNLLLPFVGTFQIYNILLAAALAYVCEPSISFVNSIVPHLTCLKGVRGRAEKVADKNGAPIFIDYAHKPDALEKILVSLRPYVKGKLIIVFGCGGNRDHSKREIMGRIAQEHADLVIITDDNPRFEDPEQIRISILKGAPLAINIGDREKAIQYAYNIMELGDVLVIAGKGHEKGQIIKYRVHPFSDHEVIQKIVREEIC